MALVDGIVLQLLDSPGWVDEKVDDEAQVPQPCNDAQDGVQAQAAPHTRRSNESKHSSYDGEASDYPQSPAICADAGMVAAESLNGLQREDRACIEHQPPVFPIANVKDIHSQWSETRASGADPQRFKS